MSDLAQLMARYQLRLAAFQFDESQLDYKGFEQKKELLRLLASVENSAISVFDLCKKEHIFASNHFSSLFGFDMERIEKEGNSYFDSRVHPEDLLAIISSGIQMFDFYERADSEDKKQHKLVHEYRIRNQNNAYVRVIEQHQVFECDSNGQPWLILGVMDISPNQTENQAIRNRVIHMPSGNSFEIPAESKAAKPDLSKRETQILAMIQNGHLSKEISDQLSISVHTVNTHRQRILEKLKAGNSMEAVRFATSFGLLR